LSHPVTLSHTCTVVDPILPDQTNRNLRNRSDVLVTISAPETNQAATSVRLISQLRLETGFVNVRVSNATFNQLRKLHWIYSYRKQK